MKLLQWNIWYKEKIENIAKVIQDLDPDILCLQELTSDSHFNTGIHTAEYLRDLLGMRMFYKDAQTWQSSSSDKKEQGNAILSKYPIASGQYVMVSPTSQTPEDFSHEGRVYLEVVLKINSTYLTIGTAHLSYTDAFVESPSKSLEMQNLLREIRKNHSHFIFAGDLNSLPDSKIIKELNSTFNHSGPDMQEPTWTTKPFQRDNFLADELKYRLDYVFATPDIAVKSSQIVPTEFSDHLPILIEFEIV